MGRADSLRSSVGSGFAGDGPHPEALFDAGGGESPCLSKPGSVDPSFVSHLSDDQVTALAYHVLIHVWIGDCDPVDVAATWSADLSCVEQLHVVCSCGFRRTFDRSGEEVNL